MMNTTPNGSPKSAKTDPKPSSVIKNDSESLDALVSKPKTPKKSNLSTPVSTSETKTRVTSINQDSSDVNNMKQKNDKKRGSTEAGTTDQDSRRRRAVKSLPHSENKDKTTLAEEKNALSAKKREKEVKKRRLDETVAQQNRDQTFVKSKAIKNTKKYDEDHDMKSESKGNQSEDYEEDDDDDKRSDDDDDGDAEDDFKQNDSVDREEIKEEEEEGGREEEEEQDEDEKSRIRNNYDDLRSIGQIDHRNQHSLSVISNAKTNPSTSSQKRQQGGTNQHIQKFMQPRKTTIDSSSSSSAAGGGGGNGPTDNGAPSSSSSSSLFSRGKEVAIYDARRVKINQEFTDDIAKLSRNNSESMAIMLALSKESHDARSAFPRIDGLDNDKPFGRWRQYLNRENYDKIGVKVKKSANNSTNSAHTELSMEATISGKQFVFMTPPFTVGMSTMTGLGSVPRKQDTGPKKDENMSPTEMQSATHAITLVPGFEPNDDFIVRYPDLKTEQEDFLLMNANFLLLMVQKMWDIPELKSTTKAEILSHKKGDYQISLEKVPIETRKDILSTWASAASLPIQRFKMRSPTEQQQEIRPDTIITSARTFWPGSAEKGGNAGGDDNSRMIMKYPPFGFPFKLNDQNLEYFARKYEKFLSAHNREPEVAAKIKGHYKKIDKERKKEAENKKKDQGQQQQRGDDDEGGNKNNDKGKSKSKTDESDKKDKAVDSNDGDEESKAAPPSTSATSPHKTPSYANKTGKAYEKLMYDHKIDVDINDPYLSTENVDPLTLEIVSQRRSFYDSLASMMAQGKVFDPPRVYTDKDNIPLFDYDRPERNICPTGSIVRVRMQYRPHSATLAWGIQATHKTIFMMRIGRVSAGYAHVPCEISQSSKEILDALEGKTVPPPIANTSSITNTSTSHDTTLGHYSHRTDDADF